MNVPMAPSFSPASSTTTSTEQYGFYSKVMTMTNMLGQVKTNVIVELKVARDKFHQVRVIYHVAFPTASNVAFSASNRRLV